MAVSSPDLSDSRRVQDGQAYLLLERLRWGGQPRTCPHCSTDGRCYLLQPVGSTRRTRTGATTARRIWKCGACRRQFSVLTGTVLQGTRVPLSAWIDAVELLATTEGDVPPATVSAATGIGRVAARQVVARWAAAVRYEPLRGTLAADGQLFQG